MKSINISKCSSKKTAINNSSRRTGNRLPDQARLTTTAIQDPVAQGEAVEARPVVVTEVVNSPITADLTTTEAIMAREKEKMPTSLLRTKELIMKSP